MSKRLKVLMKKMVYLFGSASIAVMGSLFMQSGAFAATQNVWTGTTCASGTPNCNWDVPGNWSLSAIPTTGEDLVFPNTAMNGHGNPIDNINGLAVNSITFTNDVGAGALGIYLAAPLTVNSAITQANSVTSTADAIGNNTTSQTLTLGGNVTVSRSTNLTLGSTTTAQPDTIALAGNTLSFNDTTGAAAGDVSIWAIIANGGGYTSGTVTYNAPLSSIFNETAATYGGTTNVVASNLWVGNVSGDNVNVFGTSSINIATGGAVQFNNNMTTAITNPIVIAGTSNSSSSVTSLTFGCNTSCTSPITISVPNITLTGNTRFDVANANMTVNLQNITANGHCLEYLNPGTTNQFVNGPAACLVAGNAPGLPNAGTLKNDLPIALIVGALSLVAAIEVSRRVRSHRA